MSYENLLVKTVLLPMGIDYNFYGFSPLLNAGEHVAWCQLTDFFRFLCLPALG